MVDLTPLLARRQKMFMTQYELAEKSGVTRQTIIRLEHGEPGSLRTKKALARALGSTPAELFPLPDAGQSQALQNPPE